MNLNLHIEQLFLEGFSFCFVRGAAVSAALPAELARLLGEAGLSPLTTGGVIPRVDGGTLFLLPEAPAPNVGRQLAQPILGALR